MYLSRVNLAWIWLSNSVSYLFCLYSTFFSYIFCLCVFCLCFTLILHQFRMHLSLWPCFFAVSYPFCLSVSLSLWFSLLQYCISITGPSSSFICIWNLKLHPPRPPPSSLWPSPFSTKLHPSPIHGLALYLLSIKLVISQTARLISIKFIRTK